VYIVENDSLRISILDPVRDRERFGTRYCTGGYIFQIADSRRGDLLSGPTFPASFNTFDGQGIPDSFNQVPLRAKTEVTAEALVLGIGVCDLPGNRVVEFCTWDISESASALTMKTTHEFQGYQIDLERRVSLAGRTLRSAAKVMNRGKTLVPINWFPHPFFPQPETDELCAFNIPVDFPENPAYVRGENGFIHRKGWPWDSGNFQSLNQDRKSVV
jgi:hypothetical protein